MTIISGEPISHSSMLRVEVPDHESTPGSGVSHPLHSSRQQYRQYRRNDSHAGGAPVRYQDESTLASIKKLDLHYHAVRTQLLRYQSFTTGLFPRHSTDKKMGHVRDSLYCAMACWALSRAYQRLDDDRGRIYELGQSAVKTMRGILMAWMSQMDKLEAFKYDPSPENALHSKFDLKTGEPVHKAQEYGHLQIDVVSLYLTTLCQFIASGLLIIFSEDEVHFVQNLVFYIERAYRIPDFGMWENGTRYNDGTCELHASSVGMVKAALEAINGFNLFGSEGSTGSVIYVDIDAHNRNRTTFETLLPRESNSKNTDAALFPTIGFPSFATHNETILVKTYDKLDRRLKGPYGFRRFLRDGYGTVKHDRSRRFYQHGETKNFIGIECQWPMFFAYQIINGVFHGHEDTVAIAKRELDPLLLSTADGPVLPEYYYLPEDSVSYEREKQGSQHFLPQLNRRAEDVNEPGVFLWGQSLYIIASMLADKLVYVSEIDPIHRHLPASQRPKVARRHAVFQGTTSDPVVQIAIIAESPRLQALLSTYGIQSQTPHQVEPVQIWSSNDMVQVFTNLGKSARMKLSGRPKRPLGSLSTSKVYRAYGETVICYPLLFEISDFYLAADPSVIIDDIKKTISFVSHRWKLKGRPMAIGLLRESSIASDRFQQMLELLMCFKNGVCDNVRVRLGRIQNLLSAACVEYLDFASEGNENAADVRSKITPYKEAQTKSSYSSLVDIRQDICILCNDADFDIEPYQNKSSGDLINMVRSAPETALFTKAKVLNLLQKREGWECKVDDDATVRQKMEDLLRQACVGKQWVIVRYCAAALRKVVDSLAPSITGLLVRGKQLTVGVFGHPEEVIDKPVKPDEIEDLIFMTCLPYDIPAACLEQELILGLSQFINAQPELFRGMLKIRIGWLIYAMQLFLNYGRSGKEYNLYTLSPMEIKELLAELISMKQWSLLTPKQQREINGSLTRVPDNFYDRVWKTLEKTPCGVMIAGVTLPQQPTLSEMTEYELNFALTVEDLLRRIALPRYRQIMVELFMVVATILERNPELQFTSLLDMDQLVRDAFEMFAKDKQLPHGDDMSLFYELSANAKNGTTAYLARAVVNALLREDRQIDSMDHVGMDRQCRVS